MVAYHMPFRVTIFGTHSTGYQLVALYVIRHVAIAYGCLLVRQPEDDEVLLCLFGYFQVKHVIVVHSNGLKSVAGAVGLSHGNIFSAMFASAHLQQWRSPILPAVRAVLCINFESSVGIL